MIKSRCFLVFSVHHNYEGLNESDAGSYVHVTAAKLWWMPKSNIMHTFVFIEETCRGCETVNRHFVLDE